MLYSIIITDSPKEIEHGFSTSNYFIRVPTPDTTEHLDHIKPISQPFTNIISLYDGERIGERVILTDDNPSLRLNPIPTLQISRDYAEDLESCMFNESSSPANSSPKSNVKFRKFSSISGRIGNLWNRLSMHASSSSSNPNNNRCPLLVEPENRDYNYGNLVGNELYNNSGIMGILPRSVRVPGNTGMVPNNNDIMSPMTFIQNQALAIAGMPVNTDPPNRNVVLRRSYPVEDVLPGRDQRYSKNPVTEDEMLMARQMFAAARRESFKPNI